MCSEYTGPKTTQTRNSSEHFFHIIDSHLTEDVEHVLHKAPGTVGSGFVTNELIEAEQQLKGILDTARVDESDARMQQDRELPEQIVSHLRQTLKPVPMYKIQSQMKAERAQALAPSAGIAGVERSRRTPLASPQRQRRASITASEAQSSQMTGPRLKSRHTAS